MAPYRGLETILLCILSLARSPAVLLLLLLPIARFRWLLPEIQKSTQSSCGILTDLGHSPTSDVLRFHSRVPYCPAPCQPSWHVFPVNSKSE